MSITDCYYYFTLLVVLESSLREKTEKNSATVVYFATFFNKAFLAKNLSRQTLVYITILDIHAFIEIFPEDPVQQ